jgi:uncharacterized membrane protein YozB (DUF420 family)
MDLSFLPALNAVLNGTAAALLVVGYVFIRQRNIDAHRKCMMGAFVMSGIFLVCYVAHYVWRAKVHGGVHTKFNMQGPIAAAYYLMLLTHILLAMAVPVMAVLLIRWGLTNKVAAHRRLARYALPIWLYVSVTGVLIYIMLYHLNPPAPM